ncbi:FRG domain-containing protein [Pseudomonas sp.]|uniref:FRG domain-containing protein n=1 Tax=Pseudomonas sp. TaxID=306 RepID=UPI000E9D9BFB|nr:FRG domain-containing protein [Pseudomonas sp.]HBP47787.1 hypothetical protein [Pseudomonas sp.]
MFKDLRSEEPKRYRLKEFCTARDLMEFLSPLNDDWLLGQYIFRGQGDSNYGLIPSACRIGERAFAGRSPYRLFGTTSAEQVDFELAILKGFLEGCDKAGLVVPGYSEKLKAQLDGEVGSIVERTVMWPPKDFYEVLATAQHHGVPTRLLDWSRRSYVAAYFAGASASYEITGRPEIAIWALDTSTRKSWQKIILIDPPGGTSKNLAAQSGVFTMQINSDLVQQQYTNVYLEDVDEIYAAMEFSAGPPLIKMTLPVEQVPELMSLCSKFGVSGSTLFPGYEGVAKDVQEWAREKNGISYIMSQDELDNYNEGG